METFIRNHPILSYFVLTFTISSSCALCVAAPPVLRHARLTNLTAILMFPAMLFGPALTGIILTRIVDGKRGLRDLFSRSFGHRVPLQWFATLLIPPTLTVALLFALKTFMSPAYAPNLFLIGMLFGVPAGLLEEIGWTGYAYPKMRSQTDALVPGILLGLLWAAWHLPKVRFWL